jgi:hypothetical protein
MFTDLARVRQQILDDLLTGRKAPKQAEDELRETQGNTERAARSLVGREREAQLLAAQQRERERRSAAIRAEPHSPSNVPDIR